MDITQGEFGLLCICALRYCQGRKTYMPGLVLEIASSYLSDFADGDLYAMLNDCEFQEQMELYGDELIDKPGWIVWKNRLEREIESRKEKNNGR